MRYRALRKTDLEVSEIGFGMWTIATGWWGNFTEPEAITLMRTAFDQGVNFFDAADTYGNGYSERLIAKAFPGRRDELVIATKVGYDFYNHGQDRSGQREIAQDFSPKFIRMAVDKALERLNTDRIDLLQLHNIRSAQVEDDALWETLDELRRNGKIRYSGATLGPAIGWMYEGVDLIQRRNPIVLQHICNMLEQFPANQLHAAAYAKLPKKGFAVDDLPDFKHGQTEIEPQLDTNFIVRVPHSSGLLEGNYSEDTVFPPGDHRLHRSSSWLTNGLNKVEKLSFLAGETGRSIGQAALLWVLAEQTVVSCLPNIYNEAQLKEFVSSCEKPRLTRAELMQVEELFKENFGVEERCSKYKGTMERSILQLV